LTIEHKQCHEITNIKLCSTTNTKPHALQLANAFKKFDQSQKLDKSKSSSNGL
jgi:hypothetical protein